MFRGFLVKPRKKKEPLKLKRLHSPKLTHIFNLNPPPPPQKKIGNSVWKRWSGFLLGQVWSIFKGKRAVSFIQLRSPNVSSRSPRTCGSRSSSYSIVAPVYLETEHPLCSNPFCKGFWSGFWVSKQFLTGYLEHYRAWLFFFRKWMDTWKLRTWESSVKIREMQPLQDGKFLTWWGYTGYTEFGHVPAKFVIAHFDNGYVQNKPIFHLQARCCLVDV